MGNLYIVATPIGNLEDITLRAIRVLKEVDLILAEDTRQTKKLLNHYDIQKKLERFDAKVEAKNFKKVLGLLKEGKDLALVSDAGTPGISDPGAILVSKIRESNKVPTSSSSRDTDSPKGDVWTSATNSVNEAIQIVPVPGPSSLSAALSVSGLKDSHFEFLGFLPHKKGRETIFKNMTQSKVPVIFFESPHRLMKTLESLGKGLGGDKRVQVFRELTKIHEEVVEGSPNDVLEYFKNNPDKVRGEIVIIVS